jgi:rhamnosyltransferase
MNNSGSALANDAARCGDVAAVIVTYKPDLAVFLRGLAAIARQVGFIVVVDNASGDLPVAKIEDMARDAGIEAKVIVQPRNEGLGTAINAGIDEARSGGYPFVVLLDQDSVPEAYMVARLKQACQALAGKGLSIGAVGPRFRDPESGSLSSFVDCRGGAMRHVRCDDPEGTVRAEFLISSGSLIPMRAIDAISGMDESLFIDYIDTEWCLRARSKGWGIYGVCGAIMEHSLGEKRDRLWLLRWRNISLHAPFRYTIFSETAFY